MNPLDLLVEEDSERIIVDNSLFPIQDLISNSAAFFNTNNFESISPIELESLLKGFEYYASIINRDDVLIIPEVIKELGRFQDSFKRRYNFLSSDPKSKPFNKLSLLSKFLFALC